MDERDRVEGEPPRVERETTVIHTGERSGGGGTVMLVVLLIAVVGLVLYLISSGVFDRTGEDVNVNVSIDAPDLSLPEIAPPQRPAPAPAPAD